MNKIKSLLICFVLLLICSTQLLAHSVQIAYCISCTGNLRIFVEHWHGAQDPNSTNMTIQLNINGNVTTQTNPPVAGIMNVPFGQLPGCTTPITSVAGCNGQMNTYQDWVYYDYFGLPSGVPLAFTILSGNNTFTSDGCGMYPLTVNFTVPASVTSGQPVQVCQGQNLPAINVPVNVNWTNTNPGIGIPASGTGPIPPTVATATGVGVVTYNNACGINNTTISVIPSLTSSFSNNANGATGVCLGTPVNFTNTSPVSTTYTWNFGNGVTSNVQNPTYTYPVPGVYTVSLTVGNGPSCPGTSTAQVVINPFPTANFTIPNACAGSNINIVNTTAVSFGPVNYTFTANGSTPNSSNATNPALNYATPGIYTVTLVAATPAGCSSSATRTVSVFGFAVPDFSATAVCYNSPTNFTNLTSTTVNPNTNPVTNWLWNFGAGGPTSALQTPANTYVNGANLTANTIYSVTLTATTANGCVSSITKTVTVYSLPTPSITSTPVCLTNSTTITNVGNNNGNPYSNFLWDFDNNGIVDFTGNSPSANYIYPNSGNPVASYTAITTPIGTTLQCRNSAVTTITVFPGPQAIITNTNVCSGNALMLSGATSTLSAGTFTNYAWSFGNGNTSLVNATPTTSETYTQSGIYTVTLTVGTNNSCSSTATKTVAVFGRAVIDFGPNAVCFNTPTAFTNSTSTTVNPNTGAVANYSWSFGAPGGGSSAATNPVFTYTNPANMNANITYSATLTATTTNGCVDALTKTLTVYSLPTATFTADSVCLNTPNTLTNVGNGNGNPIYGFNWSFGTSTVSPVTNVFPNSGNNLVTYTIISSPNAGLLQCRSSFAKNVWVHYIPAPAITNTNICFGVPLGLSGVTSTLAFGTVTNYAWAYGNSSTSLVNATPSTNINYAASGIYNVTLTTTSYAGCSASTTKTVSVFGRAVIDFGPTAVCFNTPTAFTNSTSTTINANTGSVASYSWNFGAPGGGSSTATNPVFTYTNPANLNANLTYSATLTATTVNGCVDALTKTLTVYSLPVSDFTSNQVCRGVPTTLSFTGNGNGNPLSTFNWDFDNNGTTDLTNTSLTTNFIFPNHGNTNVSYTVSTSPEPGLACKTSTMKPVYVHPIPNAAITNTNTCIDTQPSNMSGITSTIAIGTITNYAWAYGDGNTSTSNLTYPTTHSFTSAGNYVVTLTVTSNGGCSHTNSTTISVWEKPYATFAYSKTCFGKRTNFSGTQAAVSGSIAAYNWDFNNNTNTSEALGQNVSYTMAGQGTQTVNMLLTTNRGCTNIIPGTVYINYTPRPNFYAPKRAGCSDLCIKILDSSAVLTGPAQNNKWEWNFGNGQSFSSSNGTLTGDVCFTNSSNTALKQYDLKLILRSDSGCVDSIIKRNYISVYPNPRADFDWKGIEGNILTPEVQFTNTSIGASSLHWFFNDVNVTDSSNKPNPVHYFNTDEPRDYLVWLAVRNQYGCKDTTSKNVIIEPDFTFYIPNTFTPNGDGVNDYFTGKGIGVKTFAMRIYDRWGEMIYYTEDMAKGWDGMVKNKDTPDKLDVYSYRVLVTDLKGKVREFVGHVTLLK